MNQETIAYKKWDKPVPPERILIVRLHAIGDVSLTIPASNSLRKLLSGSRIDFFTDELSAPLVNSVEIFNNIYSFKSYSFINHAEDSFRVRMNKIKEIKKWSTLLKENKYDVVIDLQSNRVSKLLRFLMGGTYYSEFDKFSPKPASLRTLNSFHLAGFENVTNDCDIKIKTEISARAKELLNENLKQYENSKLILLNPAGLWTTRNWPIENYVSLAKLMLADENVNFLILGNDRIAEKAKYLEQNLGDSVINLTNKTTLDEAFALFQFIDASISEDSALLHFSWASGVPTLALLGSTRSDWTSPQPPHGASFSSSDLPCGDCMQSVCKYGDVHCLTRISPEEVYEKLKGMMFKT